jgi:hypothetical protein
MTPKSEPHNPLYLLLLLASLLFVLTALALAVVPTVEDRAALAGAEVPPSAFRAALRRDGPTWLLYEGAVVIVLGLASMWLDRQRLRRLKNAEEGGRMPVQTSQESPTPPTVAHEEPGKADRGTV